MAVNNPKPTDQTPLTNKKLNDFQWDAEAYRNFLVDEDGSNINDDNPLPTTQQLRVINVIDDNGYDLNAAAYSNTVTPDYDYIISNATFEFTTNESRTITITSDNGTKIYEATNTNLSVAVALDWRQDANQQFSVDITQTAGACLVDVNVNVTTTDTALSSETITLTSSRTSLQDDNNVDISSTNPLDVTETDALALAGFTESYSESVCVPFSNPSGLTFNEIELKTLGENLCSSENDEVITTSSTVNVVQIFRSSTNSFMGVSAFISLDATAATSVDDFESGVTTNWISSDAGQIAVTQSGTSFEGSSSMRLRAETTAVGQEVVRTYGTPQDYSSDQEIAFYFRLNKIGVLWAIELQDSTGQSRRSGNFTASNEDSWESKSFAFSDLTEQGGGVTDLSDITKIKFICTQPASARSSSFFDDLRVLAVPDEQDVEMELYDFGTTANPTNLSQGTRLDDDNGVSSLTRTVIGSAPQRYTFTNFPRGVSNVSNELTIGNYYGIRFKTVGGGALFYGSSTQKYTSGETFSELESSGAFTDTTKSLSFQQFYCPDAYLAGLGAFFNSEPLGTKFNIGIKDSITEVSRDQILCDAQFFEETSNTAAFARPEPLFKGEKLIIVSDKDSNSFMSEVSLFIQAVIKPLTRYG